ncbi:MAG: acyl transferase [Luteibaculum sp.]
MLQKFLEIKSHLEQQPEDFDSLALEIFQFQARENPVYKSFLEAINIHPKKITRWEEIPHLPISLFKQHKVSCFPNNTATKIFESSKTTGQTSSKHYLYTESIYQNSLSACFNRFFGDPAGWEIFALLPGYIERNNASLLYMVNHLMQQNEKSRGGFFLNEYEALETRLKQALESGKKVILIGVTHALLSFLEQRGQKKWPNLNLLETGGMKGKRRELIREELHQLLSEGFGTKQIFSEYGMTELLSQAYYGAENSFQCPPWMQIQIRELRDPFASVKSGKSGFLYVSDLANLESCCFIATEDLGRQYENKSFEVLGRVDHAELRGCNLMI